MNEKVVKVLNQINPKIGDDIERNLFDAGLIDSFEIFNMVMGLEEAFEIEIDPDLIIPANFQSVGAIIRLIEKIIEQ